MKPKAYLETTIISYLTSRPSRDIITAAHQQSTHEWWDNRRDKFDIFVSQIVIQEAGEGNDEAAVRRLDVIKNITQIEIQPEAVSLAQSLVTDGLVPEKAAADALHIANAAIRNAIADACRQRGYEPPIICTPEELMEV